MGTKREIKFPLPCKFSLLWLEALFSVKLFPLSLMLCGVVTITLPYFLQAFFGGGLKLLTLIPNSVCRWCEKMARIFGGMTIS